MLPDDDLADLDLPADAMRAMLADVGERVVAHVASAADQPACGDVDAADLCRDLARRALPREPQPLGPLLDELFEEWIPRSYTTISPGYLAFIPGGGVFPGALADLISGGTNRFTGIWQAAPALVQLEANVLDWLRTGMGLPSSAAGTFTTGGSTANLNAVVCARERLLGTDLRAGVLYASDQVHHSVLKSAKLAGILPDRVRTVAVDDAFRMRPDALEEAVREDRRRGLRPFLVVSSAGTTNTGAVDPLEGIADVAAAHGLWHHVDGAYGACFHLVPELRPLLAGLPRADSVTLDPHKGLFLPYGTGALLVRDGGDLRAAHSATAGYLPEGNPEFYDPSQHGPDLSRDFPGLRLWLALQVYGTRRYEAALAEKRALALRAADDVAAIPGVVVDAPPQLSLLAFSLRREGWSPGERDAATRALVEDVTARGRAMLTGCTAGGRFLARMCVLSFRTRARHVDAAVEDVTAAASAILGS